MKKVKFVVEAGNTDFRGVKVLVDGIDLSKVEQKGCFVLINFDSSRIIGRAKITKEDGKLIAEMILNSNLIKLYPAIGYRVVQSNVDDINLIEKSVLYCVSLCQVNNADHTIDCIKNQVKKDKIVHIK